jgi:tetratricopeptide (TPR) repeat protein
VRRIALCEEGLRRFPFDDGLITENRRRAVAESYYELGEADKAEALYREWLDADPRWGLGLDRLVGLLPIHAHRTTAAPEPVSTSP